MPRALSAALRSYVTAMSRRRGEKYFYDGRVTAIRDTATTFSATVRGSQQYDVLLTLDSERLVATCTCPYFNNSSEPCKHIWAAVLAADLTRVFRAPATVWLDTPFDETTLDDEFDVRPYERRSSRNVPAALAQATASRPTQPPPWRTFLAHVMPQAVDSPTTPRLATGELIYTFDPAGSANAGGFVIDVMIRQRKRSGEWGKPKALSITRRDIAVLSDQRDRRLLEMLCGAQTRWEYAGPEWGGYTAPVPSSFVLSATLQRDLVPRLCETGRMLLSVQKDPLERNTSAVLVPIAWDPNPTTFLLRIAQSGTSGYTIDGALVTDQGNRPLSDVLFATGTLVLWTSSKEGEAPRFAALDSGGAQRWMARLLDTGTVTVPQSDALTLVEVLATSNLPHVECPDELRIDTRAEAPRAKIRITKSKSPYGGYYSSDRFDVVVTFSYGGYEVDGWTSNPIVFDRARRTAWRRDRATEQASLARLQTLGVRCVADWQTGGTRMDLAATALPGVVRVLLAEGWQVEAEGRVYRRPSPMSFDVTSGIDWFELHGGIDFEGVRVELPALLAAMRRGERFVTLGDGTFGLLPEDWLAREGRIIALGTPESDHVRFRPVQGALLDAWLATRPQVTVDEAFARARAEVAAFNGVAAVDPPTTFKGRLRDYQREALGWFSFLQRFGFGGCLADEMGLGKTVMVLALLEGRRLERGSANARCRPSLIVVPRSLVFNWRQEAARFAPALRVLDFTGSDRHDALDRFGEHDVVLTTYGTLRRDIAHLKNIVFDYAILDEAQSIKNAATTTAKAARLLQAEHRLALSGTPVENHLGELWSLFEFLNPGMLGAAGTFATVDATGRSADEETLAMLARGLRPFILRRTKDQVMAQLPARTEQTLYCDLEPRQRVLYDQLRDHYRASLLGAVAQNGIGRAKLQILEALLRLRQAACHPGLIDRARTADAAAKLDVLVPRLQEVVEDGRKALVFSQFTTLLGLLRTRLDEARLRYEYLDGKTRDRQARVERFQKNGCPLFLISLKAGGLGLNLTAAEYVFLLDPWWNPAVEAQAIDRAHRIGQTRPVFAFRLIARDTVEEKVLELQATKRTLADAIIRADESMIRDLRREDLELLLS
jgi:superfamily II DNA or RNA helicase